MEKIAPSCIRKTAFFGVLDKNLRKLEGRLGISLAIRGDQLLMDGDPKKVEFARCYFDKIQELDDRGYDLKEEDFHIALDLLEEGSTRSKQALEEYAPAEPLNLSRKSVHPKKIGRAHV